MAIEEGIEIAITSITFTRHYMSIEYAYFTPEFIPTGPENEQDEQEGSIVNRVINEGEIKVYYVNNKKAIGLSRRTKKETAEILEEIINLGKEKISITEN